jgi:hypothetical protein
MAINPVGGGYQNNPAIGVVGEDYSDARPDFGVSVGGEVSGPNNDPGNVLACSALNSDARPD